MGWRKNQLKYDPEQIKAGNTKFNSAQIKFSKKTGPGQPTL